LSKPGGRGAAAFELLDQSMAMLTANPQPTQHIGLEQGLGIQRN
jgi:hypothetical protein